MNVYYLTPPAPPAEPPTRRAFRLTPRQRLVAFWWRLRLTALEVARAVRRFGRAPIDTDQTFLEQRANLILGAAPTSVGPARIIDFAAARTRLRA
jgi:hypothetical protein